MIIIHRPGQQPLEIEYLLIDYEGTLAIDGRIHPKAKDKINLLSKRVKISILAKSQKERVEEMLRKVKAELFYMTEGEASKQKSDLLKRLGPEKTVAVGNGTDDGLMLKEAALGVCILAREGASAEAMRGADLMFSNVVDALDFLLKPLRHKATLGK